MATHSSVLAWEIPWTEEPGVFIGQRKSWTQLKPLRHAQHAHHHFPYLPAPSLVLSLCIFSLLTARTTSKSSGPMMLFRGIPRSSI